MIALVKDKGTGEVLLASYKNFGNITMWIRLDGRMLMTRWVEVIEELDMTIAEIRLKYPEYFI